MKQQKKTITLNTYLAGIKVDLNTLLVAGEDLVNDSMKISIYDLPQWIKATRTTLNMPKQDLKLIKQYFMKVDLRKNKQKPIELKS